MKERTLVGAVILSLGIHIVALISGLSFCDAKEKAPAVTLVELVSLPHPSGGRGKMSPVTPSPRPTRQEKPKPVKIEAPAAVETRPQKTVPREGKKVSFPPDASTQKKKRLSPWMKKAQRIEKIGSDPKVAPVVAEKESSSFSTKTQQSPSFEALNQEPEVSDLGPTLLEDVGSGTLKTAGQAGLSGVPVAYADNPPPIYPRSARRRSWQGLVWLQVRVSETGEVVDAWVDVSSGHRILDRAALDAVRRWHFEPARKGLWPVAGEARVPIRFELLES